MTTIFLTRHGETEWNIQQRMQGWLDSPLTERGKLQAMHLGERLATEQLAAIYPSTAPRAIATAELVRGGKDIPLIPHEGLLEMGLGEWEGRSIEELLAQENVNCQNFFNHPHKYIPPKGAESFEDVRRRLAKTLNELIKKHPDESILIVAHGIFMRNMSAFLRQKPIQEVWSEPYKPTALSLVIAEGDCFEIRYWNDTAHYKV